MGHEQNSYVAWVAVLGCGAKFRSRRWRVGGEIPSPHNILPSLNAGSGMTVFEHKEIESQSLEWAMESEV